MHLSTIIIGNEVKSRPRFTNCQTFNIRLTDKCLFNSPVRLWEVPAHSDRIEVRLKGRLCPRQA